MNCKHIRKRNRRDGAAAVECALLAPLLVLITFASIDVGQLIHVSQLVSNASREGARTAVRQDVSSTSDVETVAEDYLATVGIGSSAVDVIVTDGGGNPIPGGDLTTIPTGQPVSVQVTVEFGPPRWINFLASLNGAETSATTIMRRE